MGLLQASKGLAGGAVEVTVTHMTPPDNRQTMESGIATGAALTQSSNPLYHCNLNFSNDSAFAACALSTMVKLSLTIKQEQDLQCRQ